MARPSSSSSSLNRSSLRASPSCEIAEFATSSHLNSAKPQSLRHRSREMVKAWQNICPKLNRDLSAKKEQHLFQRKSHALNFCKLHKYPQQVRPPGSLPNSPHKLQLSPKTPWSDSSCSVVFSKSWWPLSVRLSFAWHQAITGWPNEKKEMPGLALFTSTLATWQ